MVERKKYLDKVIPFIDKDIIKVIVGFRRSGKSILLKLIQKYLKDNGRREEQFIYINFEDYQNVKYKDPDILYPYILEQMENKREKNYVFFDEIQELKDFEKVINSLRVIENVDVYITGSNSKLLSGELATYLAGRYVSINIFPFSFDEYIEGKKELGEDFLGREELFNHFIIEGGMPFIAAGDLDKQSKETYLQDIYGSVVLRDIVERNNVRNVDLLDRIIKYIFANVGNIVSGSSLSKYFKSENRNINVETILKYLGYCADAFLIYPLRKNSLIGKEELRVKEKYYVVDHGIRECLLHTNLRDIQLILENIVAMEALSRGYNVTIGEVEKKEVDFVLEKGSVKIYLQVTYLLADEKTADREFGSLLLINDNYRKIVLSLDPILQPRDGIEHKKIYDFLLEKDW
ncbi:MAG: ATP-binding protein [Lachnospiraceae bacterium]|jgi:predicted AAA+ superfamily ATPase|nr:ATP-binding protein [Lachnospiraceae bacterium]